MNKVLLISHYPPPNGGIATWTKRLLQIGLPGDWEIVHINSNMIGGRDSKDTKIKLTDEIKRCFGIWSKEAKALWGDKAREIGVVHTCIPCKLLGMVREIITGVLAKIMGRKFIVHCRCTVPNVVNSGLKRFVFRLLTGLCDGVMVLNGKSYDFVRSTVKKSCYVELIPNFVSREELVQGDRDYRDQIHDLVYAGGVIAEKGCDVIIEAAKELSGITFHLIGSVGPEIQAMDIPENVVLYGNKDKAFVQEMLLRCDAFLFLTHYWGEGFSNSLVEAMSAGLPCIVTDWSANADMIGNDGGVIVEEYSKDALIRAVNDIMAAEARQRMGSRNSSKAGADYSETAIVPRYTKFYETLINRG